MRYVWVKPPEFWLTSEPEIAAYYPDEDKIIRIGTSTPIGSFCIADDSTESSESERWQIIRDVDEPTGDEKEVYKNLRDEILMQDSSLGDVVKRLDDKLESETKTTKLHASQ